MEPVISISSGSRPAGPSGGSHDLDCPLRIFKRYKPIENDPIGDFSCKRESLGPCHPEIDGDGGAYGSEVEPSPGDLHRLTSEGDFLAAEEPPDHVDRLAQSGQWLIEADALALQDRRRARSDTEHEAAGTYLIQGGGRDSGQHGASREGIDNGGGDRAVRVAVATAEAVVMASRVKRVSVSQIES